MASIKFTLNGKPQTVEASPEMPLLWVLRDMVGITGTKYGCGLGLCGACTVHMEGDAVRSCHTAVRNVAGKNITTIEGLSADAQPSRAAGLDRARRSAVRLLPVGTDHDGGRAAREESEADRRRYRQSDARQHLPLRHLSEHSQSDSSGR